MTIQDVKCFVVNMPKADLSQFAQWFEEYLSDEWDSKIEADSKSGKFETILRNVDKEIAEGKMTPL